MKIFSRVTLIALFILLIFGLSRSGAQFFFGNLLEGKPAPDFRLTSVRQDDVRLSKIAEGKNAILFFWATWCPHCREQLETIKERAAEFEQKGIVLLLIDTGEGKYIVKPYLEEHGIEMDVLLDEDSAVAGQYQVMGVPTYFFIDRQGVVKAIENSLPNNYEEYFKDENAS